MARGVEHGVHEFGNRNAECGKEKDWLKSLERTAYLFIDNTISYI
jgi:hypothetical protein